MYWIGFAFAFFLGLCSCMTWAEEMPPVSKGDVMSTVIASLVVSALLGLMSWAWVILMAYLGATKEI